MDPVSNKIKEIYLSLIKHVDQMDQKLMKDY